MKKKNPYLNELEVFMSIARQINGNVDAIRDVIETERREKISKQRNTKQRLKQFGFGSIWVMLFSIFVMLLILDMNSCLDENRKLVIHREELKRLEMEAAKNKK